MEGLSKHGPARPQAMAAMPVVQQQLKKGLPKPKAGAAKPAAATGAAKAEGDGGAAMTDEKAAVDPRKYKTRMCRCVGACVRARIHACVREHVRAFVCVRVWDEGQGLSDFHPSFRPKMLAPRLIV